MLSTSPREKLRPSPSLEGVPTVVITQGDGPGNHTADGISDKIQIDKLEANGELAATTVDDWSLTQNFASQESEQGHEGWSIRQI